MKLSQLPGEVLDEVCLFSGLEATQNFLDAFPFLKNSINSCRLLEFWFLEKPFILDDIVLFMKRSHINSLNLIIRPGFRSDYIRKKLFLSACKNKNKELFHNVLSDNHYDLGDSYDEALSFAVSNRWLETAEVLLSNHLANPLYKKEEILPSYIKAVDNEDIEMLSLLIRYRPRIGHCFVDKEFIERVTKQGNLNLLKFVLDDTIGKSSSSYNFLVKNALITASRWGHLELFDFLNDIIEIQMKSPENQYSAFEFDKDSLLEARLAMAIVNNDLEYFQDNYSMNANSIQSNHYYYLVACKFHRHEVLKILQNCGSKFCWEGFAEHPFKALSDSRSKLLLIKNHYGYANNDIECDCFTDAAFESCISGDIDVFKNVFKLSHYNANVFFDCAVRNQKVHIAKFFLEETELLYLKGAAFTAAECLNLELFNAAFSRLVDDDDRRACIFIFAVANNDLHTVQALYFQQESDQIHHAIELAAKYGHKFLVNFLLTESKTIWCEPAYRNALDGNHIEIVRFFIDFFDESSHKTIFINEILLYSDYLALDVIVLIIDKGLLLPRFYQEFFIRFLKLGSSLVIKKILGIQMETRLVLNYSDLVNVAQNGHMRVLLVIFEDPRFNFTSEQKENIILIANGGGSIGRSAM